jgi:hypothetical protein
MEHECRFDFPKEKCLEMGCERFYTRLQAIFEETAERLLDLKNLSELEKTQLTQKMEACVRMLHDFHILFPESSVFDCHPDHAKYEAADGVETDDVRKRQSLRV